MRVTDNFKEVAKLLTKLETTIIPNTAKYAMNRAVNAGIKEAGAALKDKWKVTRKGRGKNAVNFDRTGRHIGSKSPPWLAQIAFFKVREARQKQLNELESNFKFRRPRRKPGIVAFLSGTKEPAPQRGIGMVARRFPRRKTGVFLRGRKVRMEKRFVVRVNGVLQIFRHRNNRLAKQVAPDLDSAIQKEQVDEMVKRTRESIVADFAPRLEKLLSAPRRKAKKG